MRKFSGTLQRLVLFVAWIVFFNDSSLGSKLDQTEQRAQEKYVFAHYMVCCPVKGPGASVEDYKEEIRSAQKYQIDGFALNCGHWSEVEPEYKKRVLRIYEAAKELGTGFKLFVSDDGLSNQELEDVVDTLRDQPNQFYFHGKFVLSTFSREGKDNRQGKELMEFAKSKKLFFIPFFYTRPIVVPMISDFLAKNLVSTFPDIDGYFYFAAGTRSDQVVNSNKNLSRSLHEKNKIFMAGIFPYYRGNSTNYRLFDTKGFQGMEDQWRSAIDVGADWVELVTWNDWNESTYMAPFGSPDVTELTWGTAGKLLSHSAYLEASKYYIDWFKTGAPPKISNDQIYYFYRLAPMGLSATVTPKKFSDMGRPKNASTLEDRVYVTAFLKYPATLIVQVGADRSTFNLQAGLQNVDVPFGLGRPTFTLIRNGNVILKKAGEQEISDSDSSSRFNYFSGRASMNKISQ